MLSKGGPPKGAPEEEDTGRDEEDDNESEEASLEDEHLDDVFSALKADDKAAFRDAMKAFKAC